MRRLLPLILLKDCIAINGQLTGALVSVAFFFFDFTLYADTLIAPHQFGEVGIASF